MNEIGYPLKTIPGVNIILAATLNFHIGDINRFSKIFQIAKIARISTVENSSGESKQYTDKLGDGELNRSWRTI
ncbi:transposase [Virgibacillus sp. FSP13]